MRYLRGYHGVVPTMAQIAPLAQVTRSTNRSTPHHGDYRMPATKRYRRQRSLMLCAQAGFKWIAWTPARPKISPLTASRRDHLGQDRGVE